MRNLESHISIQCTSDKLAIFISFLTNVHLFLSDGDIRLQKLHLFTIKVKVEKNEGQRSICNVFCYFIMNLNNLLEYPVNNK